MGSRVSSFLLFAFVLCSVSGATDGPPAEVAAAFEAAIMVEDGDEFIGMYRSHTHSIIQKPNGKARHEMEIVIDVERHDEDDEKKTLISFLRDSKDVAKKHREDIENPKKKKTKKNDEEEPEEVETDFLPPWGDDANRYEFDEAKTSGSIVEQRFQPKTGADDDEGLGRGTLRWHATTLDPVSIELELTTPPKPVKRLQLNMEFERQGDDIFVTRMITDGLAKVLLLKREFHIDVRWTDIQPEQPTPRRLNSREKPD